MKDKDLEPVTSGFGKKTFNRILRAARRNRVIPNRPGWQQTEDGIIPPPIFSSDGATGTALPWGLYTAEDAELGEYLIHPGKILLQLADIEGSFPVTIDSSANPFTPATDGILFLEIDNGAVGATLKYGTTWADYPRTYQASYDSENFSVQHVSYRFPLWYFDATKTDRNSLKLGDEVFGNQMIFSHLTLAHAIHRYNQEPVSGVGPAYRVPYLVPSHGPIV